MSVPIHIICPPYGEELGFRPFFDPDWGMFYAHEDDLRRKFGPSLPRRHDLRIEDVVGRTAVMRDERPVVHWGRHIVTDGVVDCGKSETLCGIDSPFKIWLSHEADEVSCEVCKRIARVPAEAYEFVSA